MIVKEQRRVRKFVQRLNVEIQEALVAVQINTFTEILEKTQRIEIVRAQVRVFHTKGGVHLLEVSSSYMVI